MSLFAAWEKPKASPSSSSSSSSLPSPRAGLPGWAAASKRQLAATKSWSTGQAVGHPPARDYFEAVGPLTSNIVPTQFLACIRSAPSSRDALIELQRLGLAPREALAADRNHMSADEALIRFCCQSPALAAINAALKGDERLLARLSGPAGSLVRALRSFSPFRGTISRAFLVMPGTLTWLRPGVCLRWRSFLRAREAVLPADTVSACFEFEIDEDSDALAVDVGRLTGVGGDVLLAPYTLFRVVSVKHDSAEALTSTQFNRASHLPCSARVVLRSVACLASHGFHVLWRASSFSGNATTATQDAILEFAKTAGCVQFPVQFETTDEIAVQSIELCDDSKEWKVLLSADCMKSFSLELCRIAASRVVSVLVIAEDSVAVGPFCSQWPFIVAVASGIDEILRFLRAPTVSTPEVSLLGVQALDHNAGSQSESLHPVSPASPAEGGSFDWSRR
eukprot:NODE_914_length_1827_cov_22.432508_g806_i0.p1 GENE.NODE_914_length_1827_cov_22.432508_g806_i0~~NODE_914_length_1827_cov_22.432508_g806_i0.p1  ORF type:complete len:469 (-),score=69.35 NODE_914_length_1827_cov_22.432508_g806_i0:419-1771(-)